MLTSDPASLSLNEQRALLSSYLYEIRRSISGRVRRATGLDTHRELALEIALEEFFDHIVAAVADDSWAKIPTRFNERYTNYYHDDVAARALVQTLHEIEVAAERFLPRFSPSLGNIRIEIGKLQHTLFPAVQSPGAEAEEHDPIDVAIDHVLMAIDTKDFATGEHSRAVSAWATRIARRLELSEGMVVKVTRGGLIHDLGKTTTPLDILTAPRRLSADEWTIMANHVVAGWEMIEAQPVLHDFASIVRHHHEQYQGGGYPDNLSMAQIPLSTRIVTVADSFNAMIGRRPYRTPLSPLGAAIELKACRGTQFDPDITDVMVELIYEMVERGGIVVERPPLVIARGLIEDADVTAAAVRAAQANSQGTARVLNPGPRRAKV